MKEVFVIMHQGKIYASVFFTSIQQARNRIKMHYPKGRFIEPEENTFICSLNGAKFKIETLTEF